MNDIIVIGNGFDLAHGRKTSYGDFLAWYLNKVVNGLRESGGFYDDGLVNIQMKSSYITFNNTDIKSIQEYESFVQNNAQYFTETRSILLRSIIIHHKFNWVDIENSYFEELKEISDKLKRGSFSLNYAIELVKDVNKSFLRLRIELIEYLKTLPAPFVNNEIHAHFDAIKRQHNHYDNICVLNFNYTSTVGLYLKSSKIYGNIDSIINIHGSITDENNPVIFGYGDESDSEYEVFERHNANVFLENFKSFWYFKTKNYQNAQTMLGASSYRIHIMGHSCGISDRILLNSIFEKCQEIKIYYYEYGAGKDDNDYFNKTIEMSRHFKNKSRMRVVIKDVLECVPLVKFKAQQPRPA